ncbi:U3 snoRNP protein [Heterostelium album PN500]|uniref:U3 small nucleolar RNA-associated protein 11 n=1 Tax=Heterostelium pallidum (strain ATCC 26659 / Pp 5 / PN500) TaxID=670386 RepID=D3BQ99_HETP5|nr:U3 snoRNP protein [Heterostelium album PN500]EFA76319.1 U3 snoRNP protein [Heterostelium album PN500]|eukprot:XP_020428451.1 U3 snoRNP protein [Heterostelium album PN500]
MSSLKVKNLLPNREKRERPQPRSVTNGFLERKKDYKLRADDFNKKRDQLKKLKLKAALKNPEEFRFNMINSKVIKGVHHTISKSELDQSDLADIKQQDQLYLQSKRISEEKKIARLQSTLQYIDAGVAPSDQVIFLDNENEVKNFNAVEYFETIPEAFSNNSSTIPKLSKLKEGSLVLNPRTAPSAAEIEAMTTTSYKELEARKIRHAELYKAERQLEHQKQSIKNKGEKPIKVKVGGKKETWKLKRKK